MANTKISALTSVTQQNIDSINDVLPIVNASATKKATAYAITYSSLNASASTSFVFASTPTVGARVGVQGTGTSWIFNTPSGNPSFASGLVVDGSYDGSTYQSEVNLRAAGIYSGGSYGSELSLWTSLGTAINRRVTVKANGDVNIIAGNLIQGTAAKGINFTANTGAAGKTSQLLNWYEEGTFTPTLVCGSGSVTLDAALTKGAYTRIGRTVTVNLQIALNTISTPSGSLKIGGLPFTSVNAYFGNSAAAIWADGLTSSAVAQIQAYVELNATTISVTRYSAGASVNDVAGYLQGGPSTWTFFRVTATYIAA